MKNWMATDLSGLDLLVVQIDGIHITEHLVLVAAVGIDGEGIKHPLGLVEGATENAVVVQALIDNLVVRGLDPTRPRLFIIDRPGMYTLAAILGVLALITVGALANDLLSAPRHLACRAPDRPPPQ